MAEAYIVEAVRTAEGRRNGKPSGVGSGRHGRRDAERDRRSFWNRPCRDRGRLGCVTRAGEQAKAEST
jgi:hypothetical protein